MSRKALFENRRASGFSNLFFFYSLWLLRLTNFAVAYTKSSKVGDSLLFSLIKQFFFSSLFFSSSGNEEKLLTNSSSPINLILSQRDIICLPKTRENWIIIRYRRVVFVHAVIPLLEFDSKWRNKATINSFSQTISSQNILYITCRN